MKKVVFLLMMITVLLSSCGEYNKILKSTDYELKYSYAKKYFNAKQYSKSATLLDELVPIFKGTAMLKNLCICWRKVIMDKKTTRLLRNTLIPIIRLIRKASLPSWPVIIRVMDCIWIHRTPAWIRRKRMKPLTSCNYIWSIIRKANVLKKLRTLCSNCRKSSPIRNC